MRASDAFRQQGRACGALGSPMYAGLLSRLADDLEAGGPTAVVLAGHEDDPGPSALALRLLGSVHRLVLERRAGGLATLYPSVGGTWDPEHGAVAFLELLESEPEIVREWLDRPPQTNEVGRSAALMGGLLHLEDPKRLPVRLFEIGSSAGLNLLVDRFAYVDDVGVTHGDPRSPVVLEPAWRGTTPAPGPGLRIVERVGCDPLPIDATSTEGRLALTAYVWPDQRARLERLRGALALAQQVTVEVREQGAADLVDDIGLHDGTTTVLWHSVMWQYLDGAEQARTSRAIEALGESATGTARFAHLFLEPTRRTPEAEREFLIVLTTWPGGERRILGRAAPHGLPVTWDASSARPGGVPVQGWTCPERHLQEETPMAEGNGNEDLKAKMREALDKKQGNDRGVPKDGPTKEKAHGSEVAGGSGPKMHRRKAGGGGS